MIPWNREYTDALRMTDGSIWGNWRLSGDLDIGSYGILDPKTAELNVMGNISEFAEASDLATTDAQTADWTYKTSGTTEKKTDLGVEAEFTDPDTGLKVKGGVEFEWEFASSKDMVIHFKRATTRQLKSVRFLSKVDVRDELETIASSEGYGAHGGGILPGFVVVRGVVEAPAGFVAGSESSSQSFSIKGNVGATDAFMDGLAGDVKGGYSETNKSESVVSYIWPPKGDDYVDSKAKRVPLAFSVVSFDGKRQVMDWAG